MRANRSRKPSLPWRREFSLLLGLERLLSEDEPKLVDGTVLSAHQLDALSGTLTALLAGVQTGDEASTQTAVEEDVEIEDEMEDELAADADETDDELVADAEEDDEEDEDDEEPGPEVESEEEPEDWQHDDAALDADISEEQLLADDPGAARRFWFEHATGAGQTVAAGGFVEASRTGGGLILTHRRNLVDQFIGELKDRGYRERLCKPLLKGEDAANGPVTVET